MSAAARDAAADVIAALAFFGLPYALLLALDDAAVWSFVPVAVDVAALVVIAWKRWSPSIVLAAAVLSCLCAVVYFFAVAAAETCGDSTLAGAVEWIGAVVIALAVGAWGVRGGMRFVWRFPLAWLVAAVWVGTWAHVVPGGSGGCFN
jgi:hypothetical protein